jgi:hypothetical protein
MGCTQSKAKPTTVVLRADPMIPPTSRRCMKPAGSGGNLHSPLNPLHGVSAAQLGTHSRASIASSMASLSAVPSASGSMGSQVLAEARSGPSAPREFTLCVDLYPELPCQIDDDDEADASSSDDYGVTIDVDAAEDGPLTDGPRCSL